jgi:hypothetical protein
MNLKDYIIVPIAVTMFLVASAIFIGSFNISDSETSAFLNSADDLVDEISDTRTTVEEKTSTEGLEGLIENVPVFGDLVKAGKYIASVVGTMRSAFNVFLGFLEDALFTNVLGVPSSIVALFLSGLVITFGFSIYRELRK